jgi:hypothetical protein
VAMIFKNSFSIGIFFSAVIWDTVSTLMQGLIRNGSCAANIFLSSETVPKVPVSVCCKENCSLVSLDNRGCV